MKIKIIIALILLIDLNVYSQRHSGILTLREQYGVAAYTYLLSANRPAYSLEGDMLGKKKAAISFGTSIGSETSELPVSINYGLLKNLEVFAGMDLYVRSRNFNDDKIDGIGDANAGLKFRFLRSQHFIHIFQTIIKIPTASTQSELGTGKWDGNFGVMQVYSTNKLLGYQIGLEFNFLHKRDFPAPNTYPLETQQEIDSLKGTYNYIYEPELGFTVGPTFDISDRIFAVVSFGFTRNFKLSYDTSSLNGEVQYYLNNRLTINLAGTYNIAQNGLWNIYTGISIALN